MKKKFNLKKTITNFFITSGTVFAILMIIFSSVSQYVYKNNTFAQYFLAILVISVVVSIILMLVFMINRISVVTQAIIIYSILGVVVLVVGYVFYIFDFIYNYRLLISTAVFLVLGLVLLSLRILYNYKKLDNTLNANLKYFKERDR